MAEWRNGNRMAEMVAGMAVWWKKWQNSRMAEMATYVIIYGRHTPTATRTTTTTHFNG
jgi:hypothetical protein